MQTRLNVETLGATTQALADARVDMRIVIEFTSRLAGLIRTPIGVIDLVPVVSPAHPLAGASAEPDDLRSHVQLVLSDRSSLTQDKDHGVLAIRTWRIADLGAKHAMLLAGLGWGSMPAHMVQSDIAAGRLVRLPLRSWDGDAGMPRLAVALMRRSDRAIGPAGQWFWDHLSETTAG